MLFFNGMVIDPSDPNEPTLKAENTPTGPTRAGTPPEVSSAGKDAVYGKYVRVQRLGAGGMGEVWKAWDTALGRWVALKFIKGEDDGEVERFLREAKTAARLTHPHIAPVYESGKEAGRNYISMQFVDGPTLRKYPSGDPRKFAELVRDAALAVHHAHGNGIIHRDLKPDNILIGPDDHAFVSDFGLARSYEADSNLTRSGAVLGTPGYMSPEQATGSEVGPRSDVYSLGATLYSALCGEAPFTGDGLYEIIQAILEREAAPPSRLNSDIDGDLETIILKCLSKEPERRYATAAALADDLNRWLSREPILARRAGRFYRIRKKLAKRKALTFSIVLLLVAVGTLAVVIPMLGRASRALVDRMRQVSEASLDAMLAERRSDNLSGMDKYADRVEKVCREVLAADPGNAEAHYLLGRVRRAQMRHDEALRRQQKALKADPAFIPARYERALLRAREYEIKLKRLEREHEEGMLVSRMSRMLLFEETLEDPTPVGYFEEAAILDPGLPEHRNKILEDIRLVMRSKKSKPGWSSYAGGLVHLYKAEFDLAAESLKKALDENPYLEEAYEGLVRVALSRRDYPEATRWAIKGAAKDRGYHPHLFNFASARHRDGHAREDAGTYTRRDREASIRDLDGLIARTRYRKDSLRRFRACELQRIGALDTTPYAGRVKYHDRALEDLDAVEDDSSVLRWRASLRLDIVLQKSKRGLVKEEDWTKAIAALESVVNRSPDDPGAPTAWLAGAIAWEVIAEHRNGVGENPEEAWRKAIEYCTKAIDIAGGTAHLLTRRANFHLKRGELAKAVEDFSAALEIDRRHVSALAGRTAARRVMMERAMRLGENTDKFFVQGMQDSDTALGIEPNSLNVLLARTNLLRRRVEENMRLGREFEKDFREAVRCCDTILKAEPHNYPAAWQKGRLMEMRGDEWLEQAAEVYTAALHDPPVGTNDAHLLDRRAQIRTQQNRFQDALADHEAAGRLDPGVTRLILNRSATRFIYGHWLIDQGKEGLPVLRRSIRSVKEVLAREPRHYVALVQLGNIHTTLLEHAAELGLDAGREIEAATAAFDRAEKLRPTDPLCPDARSVLHMFESHHLLRTGKDRTPALRKMEAAAIRAHKLDRSKSRYPGTAALACLDLGNDLDTLGRNPSEDWLRGIKHCREARNIQPSNIEVLETEASLAFNVAKWGVRNGAPNNKWFGICRTMTDNILELNPDSVPGLVSRADLLMYEAITSPDKEKLLKQAIADCDRAIQLNPRHSGAYANRAISRATLAGVLILKGGAKEAIVLAMQDFDKSLELSPYNFDVLKAAGASYLNTSRLSMITKRDAKADRRRALELLDRANRIYGRDFDVLSTRAETHSMMRNYKAAAADFEAAAAIRPLGTRLQKMYERAKKKR